MRTPSESVDVLVKLAGVQTKAFGGSIVTDASGMVRLFTAGDGKQLIICITVDDLDRLASVVEMASRARWEDLNNPHARAAAINQAVHSEREACARLVESSPAVALRSHVALAIRKRST